MARQVHRRLLLLALAAACGRGEPELPDLQALRLPTGALLAPDGAWLFVANSNLDLGVQASSLVALDMTALDQAFAAEPRPAGAALTPDAPCRVSRDRNEETPGEGLDIVECEPRFFIQRERSIQVIKDSGYSWIDVREWMGRADSPNLLRPDYTTDGTHFSALGESVMASEFPSRLLRAVALTPRLR